MPDARTSSATQKPTRSADHRYRLPGIVREGIAQLSLLETALWPLKGGKRETSTFETSYTFQVDGTAHEARVSVYAPLGFQSIDEYVLWGLLGVCVSRTNAMPTLMATPYWMFQKLGMDTGGFQYDQLRASLERLAAVAYQNTGFYNPLTHQHERVTTHFLSCYLPTKGQGGEVDAERAWRIEWSPMFFQLCQASGSTLLFDLDLYRQLTPASRRLFLKLKDRFWRSKQVYLNVDDLTIHGLGFSADRPLKKRKFDLTNCIRELLDHRIVSLGPSMTDASDLFSRRSKGVYVVQFFPGEYFRSPTLGRTTRQKNAFSDDPLYQPLADLGVDGAAIRRLLKHTSRSRLQQWIRITDAAQHEKPRGFPGFKASPAAFLVDAIHNKRTPPDWFHAHEKQQEMRREPHDSTAFSVAQMQQRYEDERATALRAYLKTPEGLARYTAARTAFEVFYQRVEPDRAREAAETAARSKIEREHLVFPDFGVWLLEQRAAVANPE